VPESMNRDKRAGQDALPLDQQTDLERQHEGLRAAQAQFREKCFGFEELYEQAPVGYVAMDTRGRILAANLTAARLLGVERQDLLGITLSAFVHSESQEALYSHFRSVFSEPAKHSCEARMRPTDGRSLYVHLESVALEDGGETIGCRSTLTDITELEETHRQLQRLNESLGHTIDERTRQLEGVNAQLRREIDRRKMSNEDLSRERDFNATLVNTARTIVLVLDSDARIVSFNRYMEELTGYRLEEVKGRDWFETFLPERERNFISNIFRKAITGTRVRGRTNAIMTKDGLEREIEWYDAELTDAEDEFVGLLCTGQDVTERQTLQEQLLTIAQAEQQRIGEHLHDDLGQELVALRLTMDTLIDTLRGEDSAEVDRAIRVARGLAGATRKVREMSRGLIQRAICAPDVKSAIRDMCEQLSEVEEVRCQFSFDNRVAISDDQVANQLYYIAKEALTNALKHGRTEGLWTSVFVSQEDGNIVLSIRDNGQGIPDSSNTSRGSGLHLMRYRAELIGAMLTVARHADGGTIVRCLLPGDQTRLDEFPPLSSL